MGLVLQRGSTIEPPLVRLSHHGGFITGYCNAFQCSTTTGLRAGRYPTLAAGDLHSGLILGSQGSGLSVERYSIISGDGEDELYRGILVPIKVDAFVIYPQPKVPHTTPDNPGAYLAPNPAPNFEALKLDSTLVQHDIFEQIREAPYLSAGDPERQRFDRSGIYVHWSLPRLYRTGIAASDSTADFDQTKKMGGFPSAADQDLSSGAPTFRQVPNRWFISRTVTSGTLGEALGAHSLGSDGQWHDTALANGPLRTIFVVESTVLGLIKRLESWDGELISRTTVPLTVSSSTANPYFADFQPQNAGVFSFFDDLSCTGPKGETLQYCDVSVSYSIVGYHTDEKVDPLYSPIDGQSGLDRLKACSLKLNPTGLSDDQVKLYQSTDTSALTSTNAMKTICQGSYFNVVFTQLLDPRWQGKYNVDNMRYPADEIQTSFLTSHPVSVGTNAIDALFGWLRAQDADQSDVVKDLMKLQTYVLDCNDDIDSQLQAADLLVTNNFIPTAGGTEWHFMTPNRQPSDAAADATPAIPSASDISALKTLNDWQALLDAQTRQKKALQMQLFDIWWKCMADQGKTTSITQSGMTDQLNKVRDAFNNIQKDPNPVQSVSALSFFIQQDPTLFVAGQGSGWPKDFNSELSVRLENQAQLGIVPSDQQKLREPVEAPTHDVYLALKDKIGDFLACTVAWAFNETDQLRDGAPAVPGQVPPAYYQTEDRYIGKNGWFPLYIEWEVEYYHIPFDVWVFQACGPESRYGYCLRDTDLAEKPELQNDFRVIRGRAPMLPQASTSLDATLRQVFGKMNPDYLASIIEDPDALQSQIRDLDYLSTPMSGFTDSLITRM
ncbi:MAG: hypothetical protein Q9220_007665 [cf. Caloplaca sp. 1 TL-2023]